MEPDPCGSAGGPSPDESPERRTPSELAVYRGIVDLGHAIIAEAFSNHAVQPGITTTDDVVWWMRQKMLDLGLRAWFQPTVDIQAPGQGFRQPAIGQGERGEPT